MITLVRKLLAVPVPFVAASCAGQAPAQAPVTHVQAAEPVTAASGAPSPAPAPVTAKVPSLEDGCLASPWVSSNPQYGPAVLSRPTRERLDGLEKDCRDTHPDLPPGRFVEPASISPAECHYGIARIYFEQRWYPDAARWFARAMQDPDSQDLGIYAAQLYLESVNILGNHSVPARPACKQLLIEQAGRFACTYCGHPDNKETCEILRRIAVSGGAHEPPACAKPAPAPNPP